jgi:T5SS/PEP-CTERM-associated repeat protein
VTTPRRDQVYVPPEQNQQEPPANAPSDPSGADPTQTSDTPTPAAAAPPASPIFSQITPDASGTVVAIAMPSASNGIVSGNPPVTPAPEASASAATASGGTANPITPPGAPAPVTPLPNLTVDGAAAPSAGVANLPTPSTQPAKQASIEATSSALITASTFSLTGTTDAATFTLVSSSVGNNSIHSTAVKTLTYVFSEPLNPATVNAADFALTEVDVTNSFLIAIHQVPGDGDLVDGVNVQDNFLDSTGAYGPFYGAATGGDLAFIGNVDLTTGSEIPGPLGTSATNVVYIIASPGAGSATVGTQVTLTVSLNEVATVVGTPTLSLNDGGTATYVSGSGSSALTFDYTVGANDAAEPALVITQANLGSTAGIFDAAGDPINLSGITQPIIDAPAIVSNGTGGGSGSGGTGLGGTGTAPSYADGKAGAPAGTPQMPNLLASYPVRPPWQVAGVDYAVGVPTESGLKDPATISMPGVNVEAGEGSIFVTGNNVTLSGYDFSLEGGWTIYVTGSNDAIDDNYFKVSTNNSVPIGAGVSAVNLSVIGNTIDGGGLGVENDPSAVPTLIDDSGTSLTVEYNWLENAPQHIVEFAGGTLIDEYNLIENVGYYFGGHVNYVQFNGGVSVNSVVSYNTIYNPPHYGQSVGEGIQIEAQLGSVLLNTEVENNTIISPGPPNVTVQPTSVQLLNGNTVEATYAPLGQGTYNAILNQSGITDQNGDVLGTGTIDTTFTVVPASNEWVAPGNDDWEQPDAWLTGLVPTGTATVIMDLPAGAIATHATGIDSVGTLLLGGGGTLDIDGGVLNVSGVIDLIGGDLEIATGGTLNVNGLFPNGGSVTFAGGRLIEATGFDVEAGESIQGFGMAGATGELIINDGTVEALAGSGFGQNAMTLTGTIAGQGNLNIAAGSTLEIDGPVLTGVPTLDVDGNGLLIPTPSTQDVNFLAGSGELLLDDVAGFAGTIASFGQGDTIFLNGISVTGSAYGAGVLTLTDASGTVAIAMPGSFAADNFVVTNEATGAALSLVDTQDRIMIWTGSGGTGFDAPANWNDFSDTLDPAQTAPNATDVVEFDTSSGAVTGTGSVAALQVASAGFGVLQLTGGATIVAGSFDAGIARGSVGQVSLTGAGTELEVTGTATLADDGTGVLSVLAGATFAATSLTIGAQGASSGAMIISGAGSLLQLSGALNVGTSLGTGELTVGAGAAVHASVVNLLGQVVLQGGLLDPEVQFVTQGQTASGYGTIAAGVVLDEGVIQADGNKPSERLLKVAGTVVGGGTLTVNSVQAGSSPAGILQIDAGSTMELTGPVLNAASIGFTDNLTPADIYRVNNSIVDVDFVSDSAVLWLDDIAGFGGTIVTYQAGDAFVVAGGTLSDLGVSHGNTLTVADAGNGGTDRIIFGSAISEADFNIVNGDTIQVACFAAGTRIETLSGPVAVEDLCIGDRVVAPQDGGCAPIVWIGHREVNCARHPMPETTWPVRVRAGAFGSGQPVRDLYLSPDHAVFVNGVLVPVKLLIDGATIAQVKCAAITYYHVELPRHAVILAEGLPVESYLDIGDRANFHRDGEAIRLQPDFAARLAPDLAAVWESFGAAPLVMTGVALAAARAAVAGTATGCRVGRQPVRESGKPRSSQPAAAVR